MKKLKIFVAAFVIGFGFIACDSKTTTEKETVVVEKEVEAEPASDKKDDEGVSFGIERDKDGNVGVNVEGKVDND